MKRTSKEKLDDSALLELMRLIVDNDFDRVVALINSSAGLLRQPLITGATRKTASQFYFPKISHYLMAGDTSLHVAAAGYRTQIVSFLLKNDADVRARDRLGAEPLHYASDGGLNLHLWDPKKQGETISLLVKAGADLDAVNKLGVAPLHRAVRQRCLNAVTTLVNLGADVMLRNASGSTPLHLAVQNTGKGGSASLEAKEMQGKIILFLLDAGANPDARDGRGKTPRQQAKSSWVRSLLDEKA
ncbi:MAG: ankyrin repeat domain-containing protein [Nitrososphaerales archaeon]